MAKNWRPKNWEEIKKKECMMAPYQAELYFEAGADAILEARKAQGVRCRLLSLMKRLGKEAKKKDD